MQMHRPIDPAGADVMTLDRFSTGDSLQVLDIPLADDAFRRLSELGLLPGAMIRIVRRAPLGDPIQIDILGAQFAIRRELARSIQVQVLEPALRS